MDFVCLPWSDMYFSTNGTKKIFSSKNYFFPKTCGNDCSNPNTSKSTLRFKNSPTKKIFSPSLGEIRPPEAGAARSGRTLALLASTFPTAMSGYPLPPPLKTQLPSLAWRAMGSLSGGGRGHCSTCSHPLRAVRTPLRTFLTC